MAEAKSLKRRRANAIPCPTLLIDGQCSRHILAVVQKSEGLLCFRFLVFKKTSQGPHTSLPEIEQEAQRYGGFPPEYSAFLLNHNGGELIESVYWNDYEIEGFAAITEKLINPAIRELVENVEFEYGAILQNFYDLPWGRFPIAFATGYGIDTYYHTVMLVRRNHRTKQSVFAVYYYRHPLENDVPIDEASEGHYQRITSNFTDFIWYIDSCFSADEPDSEES